jgi:aspartate/methionine/tyrosine aminotransferase
LCKKLGLKDSIELQQLLLHDAGVAVLPRTSFGIKNTCEDQEYIRLCYALSRKEITEGIGRIKNLVRTKK